MAQTRHPNQIPEWASPVDSNELYEELLNRYERILIFAGQLQEKLQQQKLLMASNESLSVENERLAHQVDVGRSYIEVLEEGLKELGLIEDE